MRTNLVQATAPPSKALAAQPRPGPQQAAPVRQKLAGSMIHTIEKGAGSPPWLKK